MIPWPVSQHALHDRRLRLLDARLDHASLFPFFDGQGTVQQLMLVSRATSRIAFVDWRPGLLTRRPFLAPQVDLRYADIGDIEPESAERLGELWHFDPWWVLGNPRYRIHGAVPHLKATNIPGVDKLVKRVWFDAGLRQVSLMAVRDGDGVTVKPFKPGLLETAKRNRGQQKPAAVPELDPHPGWRLRPFWSTRAGGRNTHHP